MQKKMNVEDALNDNIMLAEKTNINYKELFHRAFEITPALMAISTIEDGVFVDINQAWLDCLEYDRKDVIGHSSRELNIFIDFDERQRVMKLIKENGAAKDQEIRFRTKTGRIRIGVFSGNLIHIGEEEFLLTTAYDITDRKYMEEVEQRNIELREKLEYDNMKASFLANVSHELKTPINILFSSLQLLNLILKKESLEEVRSGVGKQAAIMKQNCYRLIRLVNNLIDVTKAGGGHLKLNLDSYDIVSILYQMTSSVAEYGKNNGVHISFTSDQAEIILVCDIEKIERIVLNLLSNAIKFTPKGGQVKVFVFGQKDKVEIRVSDTGIGIAKAKQKQLFRRFYQVNNSLAKDKEGSGIGLSLARSLALMHGGDLFLSQEYKKGCEFVLELPLSRAKQESRSKKGYNRSSKDYIETINVEFSDIYFDGE